MKTKTLKVECQQIIEYTADDDTVYNDALGGNWLIFCDKVYSGKAEDRIVFIKAIEKDFPAIVELAADIIKNGQKVPVRVSAVKAKGVKGKLFVLHSGVSTVLAALYNACRIDVRVVRVQAEIEFKEE